LSLVTTTEDDPNYIVKNQIGAAIVNRIIRAHDENEKFKIFVMIPLLPAFPADLSTKAARDAKYVPITGWTRYDVYIS
jgi:phospholipase D1/2